MFLPRQFQVTVIENKDEKPPATRRSGCFRSTCWRSTCSCCRSPSAGCCTFPTAASDADTFVLTLPMVAEAGAARAARVHRRPVGGDRDGDRRDHRALDDGLQRPGDAGAAAAARACGSNERRDLTGLLLGIRRGAIVLILLLGYLYFRLAGEAYALVSIGLISFAAVAQFAPVAARRHLLEGRHAPRRAGGARARLRRLVLHAAAAGVRALRVAADRLARARAVRHRAAQAAARCSALAGLDQITHAMIWSMVANIGAYVAVSLIGTRRAQTSTGRRACSSTCSGRPARPAARASGAARRRRRICTTCWRASSALSAAADGVRASTRAAQRPALAGRRDRWPTRTWCTSSRCSWPARSARPRRASWSPRSSRRRR